MSNAAFRVGLIHRVAFERDANRAGVKTSEHGGVDADYQAVAGKSSVLCRVVPKAETPGDDGGKPLETRRYRVMFADPPGLDQTYRLVFRGLSGSDPPRYLYCLAPSRDAHEMGHHHSVNCQEFVS